MIGRLGGTYIGRRHDAIILKLCQLRKDLAQTFVNADDSWFSMYGDPSYSDHKFMKTGSGNKNNNDDAQRNFNRTMSSLRVSVEYGLLSPVKYSSIFLSCRCFVYDYLFRSAREPHISIVKLLF